ncbi:hypothetical protein ACNJYA_36995 [Bradyrhizobium sp. DASA03068]
MIGTLLHAGVRRLLPECSDDIAPAPDEAIFLIRRKTPERQAAYNAFQ